MFVVRMSEVMARMEERDRNHEATLVAMEKDLTLKQQAMDTLKKKVNGQRSKVRGQLQQGTSIPVHTLAHTGSG